jgi:prepilin-type N-terminal cleavage/methylation domain-containing protein
MGRAGATNCHHRLGMRLRTKYAGLRRHAEKEQGFALIELLVALLVFSIAVAMATQLYVSDLRSTTIIRDRVQMLDTSDNIKSWLTQNLATADIPPVQGDWQTLEVTSNSRCFLVKLNPVSHEIEGRSVDTASCAGVETATPVTVITDGCACAYNDATAQPLFVYRDKNGDKITDLATDPSRISAARAIDINLNLDNPSDHANPFKRTLSYALGGAFYANQVAAGSIDTAQLVDGAVTSSKIAPGSITGAKFADGSIGVDKLNSSARSSTFSFPLITNGRDSWTATSTSSWAPGPNDNFSRLGVDLSSYCVSGKTLEVRGSFVVFDQGTNDLTLRLKLVRDDGHGGGAADFALSDAPTGSNVSAGGWAQIQTPWQSINCASPDATTYFYSPQALAGDSGSVGKSFTVVNAALDLRYQ